MNFTMQTGDWGSLFSVPTSVVDKYLETATLTQIKVLLYLLRHGNKNISSDKIIKALNITEEIFNETILFWQQTGILQSENINSKNITIAEQTTQMKKNSIIVTQQSSSDMKLTPKEILEIVSSSDDLSKLFQMVQQLLGRIPNFTEQRSLIWIHDHLGLKNDIIITILSYCYSIGKGNMAYVEKLIQDWWEKDITTMQNVNNEIKRHEERRTYTYKIVKYFSMEDKNPIPERQALINSWEERKIPLDLVFYAYEKTIGSINTLSFGYINKILLTWYNVGCKTREEVDKYNEDFKKNNIQQFKIKKRPKKEIPKSPMSDAYKSLTYNIDYSNNKEN